MNCPICKDGTMKEGTGTYLKTICCAASHVAQFNYCILSIRISENFKK